MPRPLAGLPHPLPRQGNTKTANGPGVCPGYRVRKNSSHYSETKNPYVRYYPMLSRAGVSFMPKLSQLNTMVTVHAMPHLRDTDLQAHFRRVSARRLPMAPLAPEPVVAAQPAKPRKTEAEKAQPSKAALMMAARRRGLKGIAHMSREELARALSN